MVLGEIVRKILISCFIISIFLIFFQRVSAIEIGISPLIVWLHHESPSVEIDINGCVETPDVRIYFKDNPSQEISCSGPTKEEETYKVDCNPLPLSIPLGTYVVDCSCDNSTKNATFEIHKLNLDIISPTYQHPIDVSMGSLQTFSVKFQMDDQPPSGTVSFNIYLDDVKLNKSSYFKQEDIFNISARIPYSLTQKYYDLKIIAKYQNEEIEDTEPNSVNVRYPLFIEDARFDGSNTCGSNEICSKNIILDVSYYGKSEFKEDSFNFSVYIPQIQKYVGIDQVVCTSTSQYIGSCVLSVNFPALDPGSYSIEVSMKSKEETYPTAQKTLLLDVIIPVSGQLTDATGGVFHGAKLTFESLSTGKISSTTTNPLGKYSLNLLPDQYNVQLEFPDLVAKLEGVEITKSSLGNVGGNLIRYDTFRASGVIEGFKVTKIVVLEFALPFNKAFLVVPYDDRNVYDETKLKVYACHNWNFGLRKCVGDWESIGSTVYPTRNRVEFNVSNLSAFIIGEKKSLKFYTLTFNKEEVNMGDSLVISGKVVDSEGIGIEGANIQFSFPDFDINSSTITVAGGTFSGTINAPYQDGVFNLEIKATKDPFISVKSIKPIKVNKKADISILLPDMINVRIDEPTETNFTVINSGQLDLENIKITLSGISTDWYDLIPPEINRLKPNEKEDITFRVTFTSKNCGEKCSQYYLVSVGVDATSSLGEKITKGGSFTVKLIPPANNTQKTPGGFKISLPSISGAFALPNFKLSSTNTLLAIITVAVIIIAILMKEKKVRSSGRIPIRRVKYGPSRSFVGRIKKEIKKK